MGSNYEENLSLPTWREGVFLEDIDFYNLKYKESSLKDRKKETLENHLKRINGARLKKIYITDAIDGFR